MIKNKIYYVPGLISLIFLPILITIYVDSYKNRYEEHCIDFKIPELARNYDKEFYDFYKIPPKRNFIEIHLNKDNQYDSLIFERIYLFSKAIFKSKDSVVGLKVIFTEIKYATFIKIINSCLKSGIDTYYPIGDTMFIYFTKRSLNHDIGSLNVPTMSYFFDSCGPWGSLTFQTYKDYIKWKLKVYCDLIYRYSPIFLCLTLLVIYSIYWNRRFIKESGFYKQKFVLYLLIFVIIIYSIFSVYQELR